MQFAMILQKTKNLSSRLIVKPDAICLWICVCEDNETLAITFRRGLLLLFIIRKTPRQYDVKLYKRRNEVERFFLRIKHFLKIFTRYYKLGTI